MNKLGLIVESHISEAGKKYRLIMPTIDNHPLPELIKAIEIPFAEAEGHENLAGEYGPIDFPENLIDHFLGLTDSVYGENPKKTAVLECVCGCPGCWPLVCSIEVDDSVVRWNQFEQPHRLSDSPASHWDYSGFEGFEFDKLDYLVELERALNA